MASKIGLQTKVEGEADKKEIRENEIEEENERKGRASGLSKRTEGRATPN